MSRAVRLHGLAIDSDFDVQSRRWDPRPPDVRVRRRASREIEGVTPPGRVPASVDDTKAQRPFSTITLADDGRAHLQVRRVCEIEIASSHDAVWVDSDPRAPRGLTDVIVAGTAMALLLVLRGHLVLHASAVEVDGRTLAFVGSSGMGKSTLAALCCAVGARLVGDDVLRVDDGAGRPIVHGGSTTVRLRAGASAVADLLDAPVRHSSDHRVLVAPRPCRPDPVPLDAILVPARSDGAPVSLRWQHGARKLLLLEAFPRLLGWTDPEVAAQQFAGRALLARHVPVGVVTLPTGPPFELAAVRAMLDAVLGSVQRSTKPEACIAKSSA